MASTGRTEPTHKSPSENVAVIFGVTGLVGREIAKKLISTAEWTVYGVSRRPDKLPIRSPDYHFIPCDLLNPLDTQTKLSPISNLVTHLFWVTWASNFALDSKQCCDENRSMMSNALRPILSSNSQSLKHVSLQTGLKHYISLRDFVNGGGIRHFYDEDCPRAEDGFNFYYSLEDLLEEKIQGNGVGWSVIRPGLVMGSSTTSMYNVIGSLCVYGAVCRRLGLPFVFGGTKECWEEVYIDGSDSSLVAEHHIWAATDERVQSTGGRALNSVNGSSFSWREIWAVVAEKIGVAVPEEGLDEGFRFAAAMGGLGGVWDEIVAEEGLVETEMKELANWEFLDVLFRFPIKLLGSREKSDRLGFTARRETAESASYWIDSMRQDKLIP
ncbi:(S)-8-oxocitronellyl enol synthase CYC2 [Linum grandiflorum]